jgi:hypothetical protein
MRRDGRPSRAWTKRKSVGLPEHQAPRLTDLEACREAWAAKNPEALRQGITLCARTGGLPQWLADALTTLLKLRPVQRRLWAPYQQDLVDFARFGAVRAARRRGRTWELAFEEAAAELERSPAFGSAASMAKSYKRVSRRSSAAPGRYAIRPSGE